MNRPFTRRFVFKAAIFAFWVFLACYSGPGIADAANTDTDTENLAALASEPEPDAPVLTDDEINGFLFRVSEDVKKKIIMLGGEIIEHLPIPILFGVSAGDFADTWGEARPGGRIHTGTDLVASLGDLVVSPADAVVTKIGYDRRGGNFVVTANPGGEQFYFAHLNRAAENLSVGAVLKAGDLIGYIGNTGNARGKSPHLHLGIYYKGLARNPFPRLIREFSAEERMAALEKILTAGKIALGANNGGTRFLQRFLINNGAGPYAISLAKTGATGYFGKLTKNALAEYQKTAGISPAAGYFGPLTKTDILAALNPADAIIELAAETSTEIITEAEIPYSLVAQIDKNLKMGSDGKEVVWLQDFLIDADSGPLTRALAKTGATGYFGATTKDALAEYQLTVGIKPASGYFGPVTKASIRTLGGD